MRYRFLALVLMMGLAGCKGSGTEGQTCLIDFAVARLRGR